VNVLYAFSAILGEGVRVGSVFSPAMVIFIGFGVLLSKAKAVRADQDALFDIFERMEVFFQRLEIYTAVAPSQAMVDIITEIMVEVLNFIGIATKEIKQDQTSKSVSFTNKFPEEARMASVQLVKLTVDDKVAGVDDHVASVGEHVAGVN